MGKKIGTKAFDRIVYDTKLGIQLAATLQKDFS